MQARIMIKMDNDAFGEDPAVELARILRLAAERVLIQLDRGHTFADTLHDYNGNTVGRFTVSAR